MFYCVIVYTIILIDFDTISYQWMTESSVNCFREKLISQKAF